MTCVTVHDVDTGASWDQEVKSDLSVPGALCAELGATAVSIGSGWKTTGGWGDGGYSTASRVFVSRAKECDELRSPDRATEYAQGIQRGDQNHELKPRADFDPFLFSIVV